MNLQFLLRKKYLRLIISSKLEEKHPYFEVLSGVPEAQRVCKIRMFYAWLLFWHNLAQLGIPADKFFIEYF